MPEHVRPEQAKEDVEQVLGELADLVARGDRGPQSIRQFAGILGSARGYRWVGIYEVTDTEIAALAWTGAEPPACPRFPMTQGLCGAAIQSRAPVVVGDVRNDPRYLTTFGSTRSEIVVPVWVSGLTRSGTCARHGMSC